MNGDREWAIRFSCPTGSHVTEFDGEAAARRAAAVHIRINGCRAELLTRVVPKWRVVEEIVPDRRGGESQ